MEMGNPSTSTNIYPFATSERKRREREILQLNSQKEEKAQDDIEFKKGGMYVNGKKYIQQIRETTT